MNKQGTGHKLNVKRASEESTALVKVADRSMETGATTWRLVSLALLLQVVNGAPRVVRIGT